MVSTLRNGQNALVEGVVADAKTARWRGGRRQIIAHIEDDEGGLLCARFFNATPGLERALSVGGRLRVMGAVKFGRGWEMAHPKIQFARAPGKMQAIYGAVSGISQERQRKIVADAINELQWPETTPEKFRSFNGGEHVAKEALALIHRPPPDDEDTVASLHNGTHPAWRRLRFDELLAHQIVLRSRRRKRERQRAVSVSPPSEWDVALRESLPFELTAAQQKAVVEVCDDMQQTRPMRRLLQGDVGSGKTAVAAFACLAAAKCGKAAVLMAPTEILARQHYETLSAYFASSEVQCELLTGADKSGQRRDALARLRFGLSHVAVGTHALFYEEERLPPPALAVIDEQHRFGVEQRRALLAGGTSHQLMMSATPIPRTLAMSAFADTDMSVLDELPPGRKPVSTVLVPCHRRDEVLERINQQTGAAYWVCPRIEESDGLQDVFSLLERGVSVNILGERVQYLDENGDLITEDLRDYSRKCILKRYATLSEFLTQWKDADQRRAIMRELEEANLPLKDLSDMVGSDLGLFDLLCHVAYDRPPQTRRQRAAKARKSDVYTRYGEQARAVLDALLDKYQDDSVELLDDMEMLGVRPLTEIGSRMEIINLFGGNEEYLSTVRGLQDALYTDAA